MTQTLPHLDERELPSEIERLKELAYNLWWSWHPEAEELFAKLDLHLWEVVGRNPVGLLRRANTDVILRAAADQSYASHYRKVMNGFDDYMAARDTWFSRTYPELSSHSIAYFSPEYGLHQSLPLYAGGLGVLSGDHCKEASDLGLPFIGVGLLYTQGYFIQTLDEDGRQKAAYSLFDTEDRPVQQVRTPDGKAVWVSLELGDLQMRTKVWRVQVGRVPLYLLDTNVETNQPGLCKYLPRLYGGSRETRLLQEALLGIGGLRALRAMGLAPRVWHINEGHAAFALLEAARELVEGGMSTGEALEVVKGNTLFTTHTSVSAGLDSFDVPLIERYFKDYWHELGLDRQGFLDLGQQSFEWGEQFSMPNLVLRLSAKCNGVSHLHGEVSRELFHHLWPEREVNDVPIGHVTNGVHVASWLAPELAQLFQKYLREDWIDAQDDAELWQNLSVIPDEVLWSVREALKAQLFRFLKKSDGRLWSGASLIPGALTIGFARRFATFKRGTLLLHDRERLKQILNSTERPVQFVFAGKAHPEDEAGKELIHQICQAATDPQYGSRIAFIENYDMRVGQLLTRGVDVWLNTPRRPQEASGTSGQKAAMNGVLNLSILDGWWAEGFNGENGWAIGDGKVVDSQADQDELDAAALYDLLENEVVPLFYQRESDGLPRGWLAMVRAAIRTGISRFSTKQMLKEYTNHYYITISKK